MIRKPVEFVVKTEKVTCTDGLVVELSATPGKAQAAVRVYQGDEIVYSAEFQFNSSALVDQVFSGISAGMRDRRTTASHSADVFCAAASTIAEAMRASLRQYRNA